uniref:Uncharacterized protein n=1 Tax=Phlebotomus papatasi TaxID=29031 RepID=A0A1B0DFU0_PHLPP
MYVEAVPSGWELNGILPWPTSGNIERFRSNANSLQGENWITCLCVVMSTHETFREAIHMECLPEMLSTGREYEKILFLREDAKSIMDAPKVPRSQ